MLQHLPQLPLVVGFLIAFIASFSRIFSATRAFWSRFPAWAQTLFPQLALTLGALGQGLAGGVKSWTDLTVVFIGASALLLPGLPSNRSAAPLQAGKAPTLSPSAGDQAVAAMIARKDSASPPPSKPPSIYPMGGMLMLCLVLSVTGCIPGVTPKSVDQIAVLLCEDYFSAQHPTLSLHDVERGFCTAAEDIQPFLTEAKKAELRAGARAPKAQRDVTGEGGAAQ